MKLKKKTPQNVELNLTSMMDVIFLLIIFFILVTNFAAADLPPIEIPQPDDSAARKSVENTRVVNVVPYDENPREAEYVLIAGKRYDPTDGESITSVLQAEKEARGGELQVDLRADARIEFDQVQPVMQAITQAKIANINLVTVIDTD